MDIDRDLFRATNHYVWRQDAALGEGAFGTVYRGLHKETCEPVAVKTFNRTAYRRPNVEHVERELKILQILDRLKHPNVVKLIAIEDEISGMRNSQQALLGRDLLYGKVVIMELCTEGSLYSIIEQPENQFGLEETELIRVLSHTTAGLKYLRENKIVHRDWKPSNILKTVTKEGEILYKLCDFGAARELEENQPFQSIVGTEEYISPDIFGTAFLKLATPYFMATSELWSLGVTYYHVTTGRLPFKPFGGRQNRATMFQITSNKKSGDISGVQETEDGKIAYSQELPKYCRLSRPCREFFTDLLQGLLERKKENIWSFDTYFNTVDMFLSKIRVACITPDCRNDFIYLNKEDNFRRFMETAIDQFGISMNNNKIEVLCYQEGHVFSFRNPPNISMSEIAEKSSKFPVLFIGPLAKDSALEARNRQLPEKPQFSPTIQLENDYDTAIKCCSLSFFVFRALREQSKNQEICQKAADLLFRNSLNNSIQNMHSRWNLLNKHWQLTCAYLQTVKSSLHSENGAKQLCLKEKNVKKTEEAIISERKEIDRMLETEKNLRDNFPIVGQNNVLILIDRIVSSIYDTIDQFRRDKILPQHGTETRRNNELKWHDLLKKQLKNQWAFVEEQFDRNVFGEELKQLQNFFEKLLEQNAKLRVAQEGIGLIEEMILALESSLRQIVEINSKRVLTGKNSTEKPERQLDHLKLSEDFKNVDLCGSLIETVKDLQELRKISDNNRKIFSDCLILTKSFD